MLSDCIRRNKGFAFREAQDTYRQAFYNYANLSTIELRQKNRLSFHSLRHFVKTVLFTSGIPEIKVKSVLGHSSGKNSMSERYANFRPEDFDDVAKVQSELLALFCNSTLK